MAPTTSRRFKTTLILLLCLPLLIRAGQIIVQYHKQAAGTWANIIVNSQEIINPQPQLFWQNLAQGGEEPKNMLKPAISQIQNLQPKYIRLDHIFDFYNVYQGPNNFNFDKLDQVINTILQANATPFLSLSYTPANMDPQDWLQWHQLVKATAHRYSVVKNIPNIYYEVWNEPDLFGSWHYRKNPSYLTLYYYTATAIAKAAPSAAYKIGGPATTRSFPNWTTALLDYCQQNQLPLDFLSWHHYSSDPSNYTKDIQKTKQILTNYPKYQHLELILSEYGYSSDPHPAYDSSLSAVHLLSTVTTLINQVNKIFTFEIIDGPSPRSAESSGWGLLTHSLNPKPRYQALEFLNQLRGSQIASSGHGSWVSSLSTKQGQTIFTLLVNYDTDQKHHETTPVTFQNLAPGNYQLVTTKLNGQTSHHQISIPFTHYTQMVYLPANSALLLQLTPLP